MDQSRNPAAWALGLNEPLLFAGVLAAAEGALFLVTRTSAGPLWAWVAAHAVLVAMGAAWIALKRRDLADLSPYVLILLATAIAGPVGVALAAGAVVLQARERPNVQLLAAWYERIALAGDIDPVTNLCNTVAMGRGVITSTVPPPEFERVMTVGSLEDRQTALGLIARRFSPSYASALRLALVSPEPVIRVQAAAVAVKVRAELKVTLHEALQRARNQNLSALAAANLVQELQAMSRSGLLEETDRIASKAAIEYVLVTATSARSGGAAVEGLLEGASQTALENELVRQGRFDEFRAARTRATTALRAAEAPGNA